MRNEPEDDDCVKGGSWWENLRVGMAWWPTEWGLFEIGAAMQLGHGIYIDLGWFGLRIGWCDCPARMKEERDAAKRKFDEVLAALDVANSDNVEAVEDDENDDGGSTPTLQ